MAAPFKLVELQFSAESSFCENAESPGSNTYTTRFAPLSYTLSVGQEKIRDGALLSRSSDELGAHIGIRTASLEFTTYASGHIGATTGALTQTWMQDLLSDGLGGGSTAANGTTVSAATTAASITFTSNTGAAVGMGYRIGAKGDGRADGQMGIVATVAAPMTFLTAYPGTPNAADVVYATQVAYHDESTMATLGTKRFLVGYASSPTSGMQYHLMGGQLAGLRFNLPLNGRDLPTITWTYQFAYWGRSAVTIPSASPSLSSTYCAPLMGNSFFIQDVGTSTRNTESVATLDLSVDLGLAPLEGTGGQGTYQTITGWQRLHCKPMLTFTQPWESGYETRFDVAPQSQTDYHVLFTGNTTDGRVIGFYMPRAFQVGNRPSAPVEINGQTYVSVTLVGGENSSGSTELAKSAFRWFMG